jgi:predicted RNase H-like HicB family nuclease
VNEIIRLDVELRAFVRRDTEERWIAVCPSIGVASQGSDADDARRCLDEAGELWFESCIERGTLERALQESIFRPLHAR